MENKLEDIIPKTVYKYRDLNDEIQKRIITHQEIYFAKPSEFPDSYECRYKIDRDFIKNENNRRIYYAKVLKTQNLFHPQINCWISENQITDQLIDIEECEAQKVLDNIYGIFSVSLNYRNAHLWEIFGGNNKGFCVGLDFQGVLPLNQGTKGRVKYMEIDLLPKTKVLDYNNDLETLNYVFDLILSLPIDYINEQEYRMQRSFSNDSDRYMKIDKKYIKNIIIGHKMSSQKRNSLVELIREHLPETKIKRLKYNNGKIIELNLD